MQFYLDKVKASKTLLLSLAVCPLAVLCFTALYSQRLGKSLSDAAAAMGSPIAPIMQKLPGVPLAGISKPTTILFLGTDVVYRDANRGVAADRDSCHGNSDTMMLVFLNPARNTLSILHIPRDTQAYVGKSIRKINSANVIGGPELAVQSVSSLLDVPIDHYLVMNIQGLVELVNELGGMTINVPKKMSYMDWTGKLKIDLQPGVHTLTGNQSMGFVRFRHDALGDIGRIQRQQMFLQAAINKMLVPSSWLHLPNLLGIAQKNILTDMSDLDLLTALNFMHSVPKDKVKFVMLPGQFSANGNWLATTDGKDLAQRFASADAETVSSRRNLSVYIINAGADSNLAYQLMVALRKLGYTSYVGINDNEPPSGKTRIIAQNGNVADATMLKQDLASTADIVNASLGNLGTSLTLIVHDDVKPEQVTTSSADAPYVVPSSRPKLLIAMPTAVK